MTVSRRAFLGAATLALPLLPTRRAAAQAWPAERPLRLIVPVAAGGSQDVVARLYARGISEVIGQTVQVENLPGGGSNIGYEAAAKAKPDGYTLLAGSDTLSINAGLYSRLGYDPLGFVPVLRSVKVPQAFVVKADHPARTFGDWLEIARKDGAAVGTPGNGSLAHLLGEVIQQSSETRWTHVPYRGGALAVNDLLGGHLQGVLINIGAITDHVRDGRLRGLFVSGETRSPALDETPTLAEAGLTGIAATGWHGLVLPPGSDPAVAARLNEAARRAQRQPETAQRLASLGVEPQEEEPEALRAVILADAERWATVIRRVGARPD
ncbi:tripartite tricarboxylate transporter substrate binding protein [Acetobacteraceae bacterium H6797]|nr:tripartite tricarboxylate transporter substrate binding protein [Acetobacteraceae bacterium H6797]